jgi:hypothetical protein
MDGGGLLSCIDSVAAMTCSLVDNTRKMSGTGKEGKTETKMCGTAIRY